MIGPGDVNVQQHNEYDVEADGAPQSNNGRPGFQQEGSGSIKIGHNIITTTLCPDPPTVDEPCGVLERVELPQ